MASLDFDLEKRLGIGELVRIHYGPPERGWAHTCAQGQKNNKSIAESRRQEISVSVFCLEFRFIYSKARTPSAADAPTATEYPMTNWIFLLSACPRFIARRHQICDSPGIFTAQK